MIIELTGYVFRQMNSDGSFEVRVWEFDPSGDDFQTLGKVPIRLEVDDSAYKDMDADMAETLKEKLSQLRAKHQVEQNSLEGAINSLLAIEHQEN